MQGIVALLLNCLPEYCLDEFLCPKLLVPFSGFPCPKCFVIFALLKSFLRDLALLNRSVLFSHQNLFCSFCSPEIFFARPCSPGILIVLSLLVQRKYQRKDTGSIAAGGWSAELTIPTWGRASPPCVGYCSTIQPYRLVCASVRMHRHFDDGTFP